MPTESLIKPAAASRPGTSSGRAPRAATYTPRYADKKKTEEKKEARPPSRTGNVNVVLERPPTRSGLKTPGPQQQQQQRPQTAAKDIKRSFTPVDQCPCANVDILSLENPADNAGAAIPAVKQDGFHRAETPARLPTGTKCCLCNICTCGVHRCPEPSHFGASYDAINSTYRESFVGHKNSVPPEKVLPPRNKPAWAYDEFEHLEKVSTNRGDFKGIWGTHNKKVIHVDELRTGGHKFEETSSHRAAFVAYKDAVPREIVDPRSRDQLVFDVCEEPKASTMRSDFIPKVSHYCPVRSLHIRPEPAGGHMYFRKEQGNQFAYLGTDKTAAAHAAPSTATAAPAVPAAAH